MSSHDPLPSFPGEGVGREEPAVTASYASWGMRVGGSVIDGLLVVAVTFVIAAIVGFHHFGLVPVKRTAHRRSVAGAVAFIALNSGLSFAYSVWLLSSKWCATLGMRLLRLRIETADGGRVTLARCAGRMALVTAALTLSPFVLILAVAMAVDYLWPLWDPRRQTVHDKLLGTVVRVEVAR